MSSSSSSDNNLSKSFEPASINNAISFSSKVNSNSTFDKISSSSKVNKRYSSKFKKEWLSCPKFSTFLRECKTDPKKALCITCNVKFSIQNSGIGDINYHIQTKKHKEHTKSAETNLSPRIDLTYNITTTELNRLSAVEGAMVFHTVKHSHSYISQACTINMIRKCLPDSSLAKNITCDKTKAREIACNVLAPSLTHSIVIELRNVSFFSVCHDASNKGTVKMLPIVVQFFSKTGVKHGVLDFIEQQHESADALFANIKYVLEANELKLNQLVSIGSDNTNVNVGNHHSVFALFEKLSPGLIKGTCYSHVLHNSVKHGNQHLLFDIETTILKIYSHFCRSSVRVQQLANYFDFIEQEQKVILKHIKIRWLSLLKSIERLIAIHPVVKSYFLNLDIEECPQLLLEFFTSHKGDCTLYFLASVLPDVQNANLILQREYTTGVNIHDIITNLLLFIRSIIDYIEKYYNDYKSFYQSISVFAEVDIEKIDWRSIQKCSAFIVNQSIDQDNLYDEFNYIKSKYINLKGKFGGISNQVQSFILLNQGSSKYNGISINHETNLCDDYDSILDNLDNTDIDDDDDEADAKIYKHKKTNSLTRSDHAWAFLLDGECVPNLKKLVEFVFAIPGSNAFCETVFSHMNYLWNSSRNRMKHDLVGAELKIKMNTHFTCTEFYDFLLTKPDILKQIRSSDKYSHVAKVPRIA
ncbi:unnamed protein product [Adineta steineri]|uniref:HAT C-terminal dimerisation domain-containing protein n=1 Tax=Adineta steineri TaxID=433720 RepID=A0A815Y2D9_9BILA|nr:unnamed protein product [Adineta steineri]CAF1666619.1 unnamed protein product [Adineta steineri]